MKALLKATATARVLLLALQLLAAPIVRAADPASTIALPQDEMEKLLATYALIKQNYVGQTDDRKLFDGAISGMLASLDAHSQYMTPDDMREMDRESAGEYVGIGIEVEVDREQMRAVSCAEGSPAERAGIQPGDQIVSIDGAPVSGMGRSEVSRRMHGSPGSVVALEVARRGHLRSLRITRTALRDDTVRLNMAAPGVAWIRISEFGGTTGADLAAALDKLDRQGAPRGLVLDLRNDPGGIVAAAVGVAGAFLPPHTVLFSAHGRDADANATVTVDARYYRDKGEADVLAGLPAWTRSVPLTVLVNGASASAAELVAGALQDNGRAAVVGSQTFGKGSIQSIVPLGKDSGIKFTVARYVTPKGHEIQARGVTPDVVVMPPHGAGDALLLREADLANHLPAQDDGSATAPAPAPRAALESTRMFGTRDDKALQTAVALLTPGQPRSPGLAGLLRKWSADLHAGSAAGAP
jgi:carboxyl-terminal processing protease